MPRDIGDFFSPKALSCLRFFEKVKKHPYKGKIGEVDIQEVKQGGEKRFALLIQPCEYWIVCNSTNAQMLVSVWGRDVDDWVGKKITLSKVVTGFQGKEGFKMDAK